MIKGHGNDIYQYDKGVVRADFSSNVAFNNRSKEILEYLGDHLDEVCNYPDPMATNLRAMVAEYHGVSADEVLITNGSAEAFYLVAHYLSLRPSCRTAITTPSFSEYEDSCRLYNHDISFVELSDLTTTSLVEFDSVWLASPNNPDGYRVSIADILSMAHTNRECLILLDRAYNELSSGVEQCQEIPSNLVVVESFTKLYGLPGLRLGYVVASAEIISQLNAMRPPWSVNALSLVAGEYILSEGQRLRPDMQELIEESLYLQDRISRIGGYRVLPSTCNFFLVEIEDGRSASQLHSYLLQSYGLLIRDASNFRSLDDRYFRLSAQSRCYNDELINALQQWMQPLSL